jgi:hypothetical protein
MVRNVTVGLPSRHRVGVLARCRRPHSGPPLGRWSRERSPGKPRGFCQPSQQSLHEIGAPTLTQIAVEGGHIRSPSGLCAMPRARSRAVERVSDSEGGDKRPAPEGVSFAGVEIRAALIKIEETPLTRPSSRSLVRPRAAASRPAGGVVAWFAAHVAGVGRWWRLVTVLGALAISLQPSGVWHVVADTLVTAAGATVHEGRPPCSHEKDGEDCPPNCPDCHCFLASPALPPASPSVVVHRPIHVPTTPSAEDSTTPRGPPPRGLDRPPRAVPPSRLG